MQGPEFNPQHQKKRKSLIIPRTKKNLKLNAKWHFIKGANAEITKVLKKFQQQNEKTGERISKH